MATTYGRKKRGLFSSFSVFQDEKDGSESSEKPNSRLSKPKPHARVQSRHGRPKEDDSIDELASTLLNDTSEDPLRTSPRSHASPIARSQSSSSNILSRFLSKPLNSSPPGLAQPEHSPTRPTKSALTQKTTNMKAFSRNRQALKQSISSPIQQMLNPSGDDQSQRTRRSDDAATTFSTATGAADLSKKISNLMAIANSERTEGPTGDKDDTSSKDESRTHRLHRGRKAFVKAGKAIVERFSNSLERTARKDHQDSDSMSVSSNHLLAPDLVAANDTAGSRMSRRIAEGTNLNNPKIRSLTGDGNVPRKPLPAYENMKRSAQNDKSLEHRFSDSHRSYHGSSRQGSLGLDVDVGVRKSRPTSMQEPLLTQSLREDSYQPTIDASPLDLDQPSRFSESISGLAQHPDVTLFSSSPEGSSTPRVRLEPTYTATGKKRLTIVPTGATSPLDPSTTPNDETTTTSSGDELANPSRSRVAKSLSLKRKTATQDLRTAGPRPSKKSKKASIGSKEEMVLASGIDRLETHDPSALQARDSNKKLASAVKRDGSSTAKGLGIFDTDASRDARRSLPSTGAKKLRRRASKRSSIPKPVGRVVAGRDRRASSFLMAGVKGKGKGGEDGGKRDGMEVDDLQLDLSEYHLGTRGR